MTKLIMTEHNVTTGQIIEREMTADEVAQFQADKKLALEVEQAKTERAAAKVALLEKLGINEDEARLLLG
jgi:hypothetical protein